MSSLLSPRQKSVDFTRQRLSVCLFVCSSVRPFVRLSVACNAYWRGLFALAIRTALAKLVSSG